VLVGLQVPPRDNRKFKTFLNALDYRYWDESKNPACTLFLK
jgi:threonine dehydratase